MDGGRQGVVYGLHAIPVRALIISWKTAEMSLYSYDVQVKDHLPTVPIIQLNGINI